MTVNSMQECIDSANLASCVSNAGEKINNEENQ